MTRDEFNAFCATLPATNHVVQWGNSDVWKVDTKLFAVCGWADDFPAITFKVGDIAWEVLQEQPGIRPAPYLASRGMKWLQHYAEPGLSDAELKDHIRMSYDLVIPNLTRKRRDELGIKPLMVG